MRSFFSASWLFIVIIVLLCNCSDSSDNKADDAGKTDNIRSGENQQSGRTITPLEEVQPIPGRQLDGPFSIPELSILPSPNSTATISFTNGEKVIAYDVSPEGKTIALISENKDKKRILQFWEIGRKEISESIPFPDDFSAEEITWHPLATSLFVLGKNNSEYTICHLERTGKVELKNIFTSSSQLKRLVACPRPFIVGSNYRTYFYRLFFGMAKEDGSYRIMSVTETGNFLYQVIGPEETITGFDEEIPSKITSDWALPVAFHPGGHYMIWEGKNNKFNAANYNREWWGKSNPLKNINLNKGIISPLPNGLGLLRWQKDMNGIGVNLHYTNKEEMQIPEYNFIAAPVSVPDGKGVVGLTLANGSHTLCYVPVKVPLADVFNAWMFLTSPEEINLFMTKEGLFRPSQSDQLYKLYETENYHYCGGYDRSIPTRPYLVTTDIFWEIYSAAYQGIFIIKERDEAIPNFKAFIEKAEKHFKKSESASAWTPIFTALADLNADRKNNPEVQKILQQKKAYSDILRRDYDYEDLKPRGHYNSSEAMKKYFMSFRYLTTSLEDDTLMLKELNNLPAEIKSHAVKWINCYSSLISPSRAPLLWSDIKNTVPVYANYPKKEIRVFPLSWGFDNEVLFSTVYHQNLPPEKQIIGPAGARLLPSGLDLAAALGSSFAESLLQPDYEKYPPLRKVIDNLKNNYRTNCKGKSKDLYSDWINALSVQFADVPGSENSIWPVKRIQTGLASWATLRHATILVNERSVAECGEGGFEEMLARAPRGYVEPDPEVFEAIAKLFEATIRYVPADHPDKAMRDLYAGIIARLKESAESAREFKLMAEKQQKGISLSNEEYEKILFVARVAEHNFLVFNSISKEDQGISNPDPIAKIADVAHDGLSNYLMVAVGNSMEWDHVVPFYGRRQIVKGSVYSYYEFPSSQILNDEEWQKQVSSKEYLPWIKPYISSQKVSYPAVVNY